MRIWRLKGTTMLNKTILQGRFTKNPTLKYSQNNIAVCSFTLACNEKYKDKESTLFLNCIAYRQTAEFIVKYFVQGDQILLEGKLNSRNYEDNQGVKRYVTELIADKAHFCGGSNKKTNEDEYITSDGDLPFDV